MSKPWLHVETEETPEGTSVVIRGTFVDDSPRPVELVVGDFISLDATLLDQATGVVIGDWDEKNVLGVNGGSFEVPPGGTIPSRFRLHLTPEDTELVGETRPVETRRLLLRWAFNSGEDVSAAEVTFPIRRRAAP